MEKVPFTSNCLFSIISLQKSKYVLNSPELKSARLRPGQVACPVGDKAGPDETTAHVHRTGPDGEVGDLLKPGNLLVRGPGSREDFPRPEKQSLVRRVEIAITEQTDWRKAARLLK